MTKKKKAKVRKFYVLRPTLVDIDELNKGDIFYASPASVSDKKCISQKDWYLAFSDGSSDEDDPNNGSVVVRKVVMLAQSKEATFRLGTNMKVRKRR